MWRMTRRARGERGAAATLVAILMAGGALFGMAALTIDVGQIYSERRELQNGADGGALAVAQDCAKGLPSCNPSAAMTQAEQYANDNAKKDGVAAVPQVVCGNGVATLPTCPAPTTSIYDCPAAPTVGNFVEVETETKEIGGDSLLPPSFAQMLVGNEGYSGTTVHACARAAWGAPSTLRSFAATISICEWNAATNGGDDASYVTLPPWPPYPPAGQEQKLELHGQGAAVPCGPGATPVEPPPSGWNQPGGFGWLDEESGGLCQATITVDEVVAGGSSPGVGMSSACREVLDQAIEDQETLFVPIFSAAQGSGQNADYIIEGFAAFVPTGYRMPGGGGGQNRPSEVPGSTIACTGSAKCIYGFFTQDLVPADAVIGTGPNMGATVISLIG
ncbi:MAG: pilus assembly protein TadG-related protein [Actinomycetes bacterium]